jgi:hypothetical protein
MIRRPATPHNTLSEEIRSISVHVIITIKKPPTMILENITMGSMASADRGNLAD